MALSGGAGLAPGKAGAGRPGVYKPPAIPKPSTGAKLTVGVPKPPPGPKGAVFTLTPPSPVSKPAQLGPSGGVAISPQPAPPKAPGAAAPGQTPGTSGTAAPASPASPAALPYDATYYTDLAAATAAANGKINAYNADIANGSTNLNNTLAQLQYNQGQNVTRAQNTENARGGFAQGALGNTIGQINRATLDAGSANTLKFQQNQQAWNSAIAAANQGLSVETIALQLAAADREAARVAASGGTLGTAPTPPAAAAPVVGASTLPSGKPGPYVLRGMRPTGFDAPKSASPGRLHTGAIVGFGKR